MKHITFLLFFLSGTFLIYGQKLISTTDINSKNAGEGDLYKHESSPIIYIGLSDGSYHAIDRNLQEILAAGNSANHKKITNLGTPTDFKDAVTKEYVDNLTGSGSWKLTGNKGTSNRNFIGTTDTQDLVFKANNTEKLRLVNDKDQVLINSATSFRNHPLVIKANGNDVLAFEDATGTPKWHWNLLANGLNFVESGVLDFRLFLKNGGNVGINTSTPSAKLHIAGDMQLDQAFKDKDGDVGTFGQILSSTATGSNWIDLPSVSSIYTDSDTLTGDRVLTGDSYNLSFNEIRNFDTNVINRLSKSLTSQFLATNNIELKSSNGDVEIAANSGTIQLQNNTNISGNLSVTGTYSDSTNDSGSTGDVLSSTGTTTDWHPLISNIANNAATVGLDKGIFVKKQTIVLKSQESTGTQDWIKDSYQMVSEIKLEIYTDCLIDIDYVFSYRRTKGTKGGYRAVYVDIDKSGTIDFKEKQMSSMSNTYEGFERRSSCTASRKYIFTSGVYTFTMITKGTNKCKTEIQANEYYGWSFDITATPIN
ncbi:MAG: hypothetical protein COB98_08940 [Flavobacteriaceae bacterium]|nr:MAG: hypothetical protein COB98_08940 [Flavobacteriaceae bacterium]